ncbi:hypothetical protein EJB05_41385 [Eragrostis curvula]|uniref:Polyadenylate-binding protein n=1 Tax=Eragrostis curvula TaxID=38414 RepID=A0A5J9T9I3_9POAL|nr:hypothetical protein EJB05_41385 [Eragrostis curvula]
MAAAPAIAATPPPAADAAPPASLYVGDLAESVTENELFAVFSQIAPLASVRVCRDIAGHRSLGYGYVNFHSRQDASRALQALNFTPVNGKAIRIMFSNRDPSMRKSGRANVFVKNLEPNIDSKSLHEMFSPFGTILSCKVVTDSFGQSKGYGFVQFEVEESAQDAINGLNGMLANGSKIFVGLFKRRSDREVKFTNVYIKNLPPEFSDDDLRQQFAPFGEITSAAVMRDAEGASRGFGFVNFEKPESAAEAVQKLNGKSISDKVLYVGRAQKKEERRAELRAKFEHRRNGKVERFPGLNLYLKNLDDSINDEKLKKLFQEFGEVSSCKVMVDAQGRSKGSGFVSFTTAAAGYNAINGMHGKMMANKPLYVGLAQRKEERRAMLMAHFAYVNQAMTAIPYAGPQQVYFGHPAPGQILPQAAVYGFQQQFVPGMRSGSPVMMPNNVQRSRHPGQRTGYRQQQQVYADVLMIHANANHSIRYTPNARNGAYTNHAAAQMDAIIAPPTPNKNLTTALASADPAQQLKILGNKLHPLVEQLERVHAAKVTGMLLEMDKTEVLHLMESPDALRHKVREAMAVLQRSMAAGSADAAATAAAPSVKA